VVAVSLEGVLVAVGWSISVLLWAVLYKKSRNIDKNLKNIWNAKVELEDLNGEVIKVPVQVKKGTDAEGNDIFETKMVIAPLWYTIAQIGGTIALQHFQAWFNNQKSHLSKRLQAGALGDAAKGELDLGTLMTILPKKAQTALALIMAAKGVGGQGIGGASQGSGGQK
jgi:hypothetical protein